MSWTQQILAGNFSWAFTTCDSTGNIIYSSKNADIYKSSDGGVNWALLYTASFNIQGVSTDSLGQNVVIFGTTDIYVSSDSGANWQSTTATGFDIYKVIMDSNTGQILYAFGPDTFAKSTNFGTTWTTSAISLDQPTQNGATCSSSGEYIYYFNGQYIYFSSNAGSSFTNVQTLSLSGYPASITCSSNGQKVVMCITSGDIYVSNDNFSTYNTVTISQKYLYTITCDTTGQNIAVASSNGGAPSGYVYVSNDGGVNFTQSFYVPNGIWNQIRMNSSGSFIVACLVAIGKAPGYIYTYGTPSPYPPPLVCFKEGSKILTDNGYKPIETLRKGDLVKTLKDGFIPIDMIGKRDIYNPSKKDRIKDQLYKCSQDKYPELIEDLVITGCHSILVDNRVTHKQVEQIKEVNGDTYFTDDKLRLPACVDERASVYEVQGNFTIYHIALENDDYYMNYGIYANGLLVETCSKRYLKELSNMTLI